MVVVVRRSIEGEVRDRRQRRSSRENLDRRPQLEGHQQLATGHRRGIGRGAPPVVERQ